MTYADVGTKSTCFYHTFSNSWHSHILSIPGTSHCGTESHWQRQCSKIKLGMAICIVVREDTAVSLDKMEHPRAEDSDACPTCSSNNEKKQGQVAGTIAVVKRCSGLSLLAISSLLWTSPEHWKSSAGCQRMIILAVTSISGSPATHVWLAIPTSNRRLKVVLDQVDHVLKHIFEQFCFDSRRGL